MASHCTVEAMTVEKRVPLPAGAVIEFCDEHATVIHDQGDDGVITVDLGDHQARWRWTFEGVSCRLISLPDKKD